jgi:hypothetical protein
MMAGVRHSSRSRAASDESCWKPPLPSGFTEKKLEENLDIYASRPGTVRACEMSRRLEMELGTLVPATEIGRDSDSNAGTVTAVVRAPTYPHGAASCR